MRKFSVTDNRTYQELACSTAVFGVAKWDAIAAIREATTNKGGVTAARMVVIEPPKFQ